MAIPWDSLIAAAAGLIGGLGGAGVNGHYSVSRERLTADRADTASRETGQRDAYASLVVAARAALRHYRQLRLANMTKNA